MLELCQNGSNYAKNNATCQKGFYYARKHNYANSGNIGIFWHVGLYAIDILCFIDQSITLLSALLFGVFCN